MTIKRRNKLPKRLKERCKKLRIRITTVRNGKRVYKTKKAILKECKKKLKRNKFGSQRNKRRHDGTEKTWYESMIDTIWSVFSREEEEEDTSFQNAYEQDEDSYDDDVDIIDYLNNNSINKVINQNNTVVTDQGDIDLLSISQNNLNHLSQGMKAIDIIHDIKNNFQRGVGAVRNFLKGDSNNDIFNMNTFMEIFKTFDYKSEKKVIAAYIRRREITPESNNNILQIIQNNTFKYIVVDGVIQDDKGYDIFTNSCKFCRMNNNNNNMFKARKTMLFLKYHYADYVNTSDYVTDSNDYSTIRLTAGGIPTMNQTRNILTKYTKNFLYLLCSNAVNTNAVNTNYIDNYLKNSDLWDNYYGTRVNLRKYHYDAKEKINKIYNDIQNDVTLDNNKIILLTEFYKFIINNITLIIPNPSNRKLTEIFYSSKILLDPNTSGDEKKKFLIKIHKKYHTNELNLFNILDASSGGNYSYNLTVDCFDWISDGIIPNPMLTYGKSYSLYPMIDSNSNSKIIQDGHFLYSLEKINDQQQFKLQLYIKIPIPDDTLTAIEYSLPFEYNNSDYEIISKFVTIKSTTFEKFENNVIKYITHISNNIRNLPHTSANVKQIPYQVINNKNAFLIQMYPDCHTGAYQNTTDVRPWEINNRCIVKLRTTYSALVRYIDANNKIHYIVLSSVLPSNPIVKEYVRLFELCKPKYYNEQSQQTIIPTIDTEKMLLSLMNYKRISDVLQYYGLREQLDTEGNKNGLLITKDQSAFLQYFHIKYKLNGNQGPDARITILLDVQKKNYHFHAFGKKRKNVINNLVKKFEELTNFPLVEYEFYKEGDLVKARQRINSLIVSIKDNQEAIDIVNRIFRLTGIKPTTKKYIREMEIHNKRTKQLTEGRNKENIMKVIKFLQKQEKQKREREKKELKQRQFLRNFNPNTGRGINEVINPFNQNNLLQAGYAYGKTKKKRKKRKIKRKTKKKVKRKVKKKRKKKVKRRFLYNPNNPKKSFDVYIDKNPKDTIPIKYTTVKDVRNTIRKLERLYKTNKYPHTRIWKVGMILKVRLEAIVKNTGKKKEHFRHAKNYFHFLGQRTKKKGDARKKMVFKFNKTYRKVS